MESTGGLMIRQPTPSDWELFFALAANEGWRVPYFERRLFQGFWSHSVKVLEVDSAFAGLVTAVAHERSGWIGNLIVPAPLRGRGYGSRLFMAALSSLQAQRVASIWLTASELGRPIYEKSGFTLVDTIERWASCNRFSDGPAMKTTSSAKEMLCGLDLATWGEARTSLLDALFEYGRTYAIDDTVALLQQEPALQIIGPWYSPSCCPRANRQVLQQILAAADPDVEIVVDILSSSPLRQLLTAAGFACSDRNSLMVRGDGETPDLSMMVSLASLGSIG
jgi:GNAT superfamily N-acetyltransferase